MTRCLSSSLDQISPLTAAAMLHDRGVGILSLRSDSELAQALLTLCADLRIRAGRMPNDFPAVRAEHARLAFEAERIGRSRECARYHPEPSRRQ